MTLQILLVRHGKPAIDDWTPIAGSAFAAWVRAYDLAPIDVTVPPAPGIRTRLSAIGCVATSPVRRAQESAAFLAPGRSLLCDALFAEVGIPSPIQLSLALAPRYWTVLCRVAWFCGWSHGAESLRHARSRAFREEGTSDDRLILRLRELGLIKQDVSNLDLIAVFEMARSEHAALPAEMQSFNSPHERVRVFLAPHLSAKGLRWAVPLESLKIRDE